MKKLFSHDFGLAINKIARKKSKVAATFRMRMCECVCADRLGDRNDRRIGR